MALLADAPRSATVLALHDSYLIRLPRRAFDVVMEGAPDARRYLFRVLTSRLQHTSSGDAPAVAAEKIAIIPLGPVEPVRETLDWLAHKVSPTIIGSACQEDRWDHGGAIAGQKVVYMANNHHSAWARRCIDQADRVIFVARCQLRGSWRRRRGGSGAARPRNELSPGEPLGRPRCRLGRRLGSATSLTARSCMFAKETRAITSAFYA